MELTVAEAVGLLEETNWDNAYERGECKSGPSYELQKKLIEFVKENIEEPLDISFNLAGRRIEL